MKVGFGGERGPDVKNGGRFSVGPKIALIYVFLCSENENHHAHVKNDQAYMPSWRCSNLVKTSNMKPQTTFHDSFYLFYVSQLVPSPEFPLCPTSPNNSFISIALPLNQKRL